MKILVMGLIAISLNSCDSNTDADKQKCKNINKINNSLYEKLLSYQKQNPIPLIRSYDKNIPPPPETAFRYIYEVQIKSEKDTVIIISLKPDGVTITKDNSTNKIYGVYEDSCLKATYFVCDSSVEKSFLTIFKKDNFEKYHYDNSSNIDFFYDQYLYVMNNSKLVLKTKIPGNRGE